MQLIPRDVDTAVHALDILVLLGVGRYLQNLNRLVNLMHDYPPHRHDNGHLIFPYGYEPTKVGKMNGEAKP